MKNRRAEGPTWVALLLCYAAWAALTVAAGASPWACLPLAFVIAFHGSLQHEAIHGHPTRWPAVNQALVFPPLGLAFPYGRYRDLHLAHHRDARLTDPYDDPESWYLDPAAWAALPRPARILLMANNCLVGRLLLGPAIGFARFACADARRIARGDRAALRDWALHAAGAAAVILWLTAFGVALWAYALACYGALSLLSLRSFLEHRADQRVAGRSAIVEGGGLLGLLFLNNNLHAVHHAHPDMAWSALPAHYRRHRDRFIEMNGGYRFASYAEVARAYAFRPKEPPAHPDMESLGR